MKNPKILTVKAAAKIAEVGRKRRKTIVTINGSFDLFHTGHLETLKRARALGDILFVGLNSDKSYKEYKDKRGSIISEHDRAELLAALSFVDYVVIFDDTTPIRFIKEIRPAIHCNAASYGTKCVEAETVKEVGAKLKLIKENNKSTLSTSAIIKKIIERYGDAQKKCLFVDRDGILNVDHGYVFKLSDLKLMPDVAATLHHVSRLGYSIIVVTNQSGISRGYYSTKDMEAFNKALEKELAKDGVKISAWYICPHSPEDKCDCRKPGSVLFQRAIKEHNIDAAKSFSLGDKESDMVASKRMRLTTILLESQYTEGKECRDADHRISNLSEVKSIIKS